MGIQALLPFIPTILSAGQSLLGGGRSNQPSNTGPLSLQAEGLSGDAMKQMEELLAMLSGGNISSGDKAYSSGLLRELDAGTREGFGAAGKTGRERRAKLGLGGSSFETEHESKMRTAEGKAFSANRLTADQAGFDRNRQRIADAIQALQVLQGIAQPGVTSSARGYLDARDRGREETGALWSTIGRFGTGALSEGDEKWWLKGAKAAFLPGALSSS